MNEARLVQMAEWLEAGAPHQYLKFDITTGITFDQRPMSKDDIPTCATSCCIAGAACFFFNDVPAMVEKELNQFGYCTRVDWTDVTNEATDLLGLTIGQANKLFIPWTSSQRHDDDIDALSYYGRPITYNDPAWAARVIRHFLATGVIDWRAVEKVVEAV